MAKIEIYTSPWCGYCARAKALLEKKGAAFEEMDVMDDEKKRAEMRTRSNRTTVPQIFINGHLERRVPHNLNVSFNFVEGESLIMAIKDVAVSSGSACTSASLEPSFVLRALGLSDELAHSSIRMTIGRFSTEEEIDFITQGNVEQKIQDILLALQKIYGEAKQGNLLREGMTVVLVGQPNVGKSSLINQSPFLIRKRTKSRLSILKCP